MSGLSMIYDRYTVQNLHLFIGILPPGQEAPGAPATNVGVRSINLPSETEHLLEGVPTVLYANMVDLDTQTNQIGRAHV